MGCSLRGAQSDSRATDDASSPSSVHDDPPPRLLHRLLRGELDEADIHRAAAELACTAAAAASAPFASPGDQQQQQQLAVERADDVMPSDDTRPERHRAETYAFHSSSFNT